MNNVTLIGRLTKDPEYRVTDREMQICRFTLAVDRAVRQGKEKETDFIGVKVFGKQAENCNEYLGKGKMAGVQGRIQTGSYQDKDGKTVYTTEVIGDRVEFLTPKDKTEQKESYAQLDEDVPF